MTNTGMATILLWAGLEEGLGKLLDSGLNLLPPTWRSWALIVVLVSVLLGVFATLFALSTLLERKGLGRMQNRLGPNRVGPYGLFQPVADGIKMLTKEDIVPHGADGVVHFLAPIVLFAPLTLAFAVLPYGRHWVPLNLDAGLLFFFAAGSASELAAFMAGWSSRNKYSLLGGMRAIAQMISFEMPLVVASLSVVMISGTMSLAAIVERQEAWLWIFPKWNVFTPWGLAGFVLFIVAAMAETNRSPFDLPEGESEIIGGFMTEYSGFKYAVFFMGEYFGMFAVSGLAVTLFLGGWNAPLSFLPASFLWFFAKLMALVLVFIWVRGTLPRVRADQLMNLAWKYLFPMSLLNMVTAALWHYTAAWPMPGGLVLRWIVCFAAIAVPCMVLARVMMGSHNWAPRVYQFGD
jgi:NADH-quinone oxidoreductase subunit H